MTEVEFRALLAVENKKMHVMKKIPGDMYVAAIVSTSDDPEDIVSYAYGTTEKEVIQNLITQYYADN